MGITRAAPVGRAVAAARDYGRDLASSGLVRVRRSLFPAIAMTVGAVLAYFIAEDVLGHSGPIFAATSALISLGFGRDLTVRKVLEVAIGCTLGIAVGDLLMHFLGAGLWQAGIILFVSILLARFLDRGVIFATQLGLQSVLVVLLPAPAGGPFTRSLDAVVGGLIALTMTALLPRDPRVQPRRDLQELVGMFSTMLRECSAALADADSTRAWHALVRGRSSQSLVDAIRGSLKASSEVTRIAPAYRRHRAELEEIERAVEFLDLGLRNGRVVARRLTSVINNAALTQTAADSIADLLAETADALDDVALGLVAERREERRAQMRTARLELADIAARAHPRQLHVERLEGEALVILLRPMLVDLLEATGHAHDEAVALLPRL
ncbi:MULTISPECIES: FUSC family protein [Sinomonas]|uniref:FUSC family protein n=1 Tax=Sinomonas TaxID=596707 RepID=UPI000B5EB960|nr:FUSC family protein [Sinomonas sp. R1AF57]ASN50720.1 FUSC family protein [Sinomonas sp. R1AF57]